MKSIVHNAPQWDGLENKHSTECDIRPEFPQPSRHATGAAPTGRRRGAGQPAEIGRRSSDRRSRSSNREFHFAELGTFAPEPGTFAPEPGTLAREHGGYCANPGTFSICSTVSFRQLLANSSEPAPPGMRQLLRQSRLMNTLKFIPLWSHVRRRYGRGPRPRWMRSRSHLRGPLAPVSKLR
jgi:hypothetical protein